MTKHNLGSALLEQGRRQTGEESIERLRKAVQAYRDALEVYSGDELAHQRASTQASLAVAERTLRLRAREFGLEP